MRRDVNQLSDVHIAATNSSLLKDSVLDRLAETANIAQFASFDPTLRQRYVRIRGYEANYPFSSVPMAVRALLKTAGSVNIRSFEPERSKSREFVYGLKSEAEVVSEIERLADNGLYTIINETVDVN